MPLFFFFFAWSTPSNSLGIVSALHSSQKSFPDIPVHSLREGPLRAQYSRALSWVLYCNCMLVGVFSCIDHEVLNGRVVPVFALSHSSGIE